MMGVPKEEAREREVMYGRVCGPKTLHERGSRDEKSRGAALVGIVQASSVHASLNNPTLTY